MSKKRTKRFVFWIIFGHLIFTIMIIGYAFVMIWQPWHYPRLLKHYSDDNVYIQTTGCISECDTYCYLHFEWVLNQDGERIDGKEIEAYRNALYIYAPNQNEMWEALNPEKGMVISFIYAYGDWRSDFYSPIVQITKNDNEILSFEDGKASLIKHLNNLGIDS